MDSPSSSPSPPVTPPVSPDACLLYSLCDPIYFKTAAIPRLLNPRCLAERASRETITWRSRTPMQKYDTVRAIYDNAKDAFHV